jgi:hypothetical protein
MHRCATGNKEMKRRSLHFDKTYPCLLYDEGFCIVGYDSPKGLLPTARALFLDYADILQGRSTSNLDDPNITSVRLPQLGIRPALVFPSHPATSDHNWGSSSSTQPTSSTM